MKTSFATKAVALSLAVITAANALATATAAAQGYSQYPGPGAGGGYARQDGPGAGGGYARPYRQGGQRYGYAYRQGGQTRQGYGQGGQGYSQRPRPVAQWMCQYGARETNPRIKLPAILIQFQFVAFNNGQAFGRGTINQQSPIQIAGRWQAGQGQFKFRGQSSSYGAAQPFQLDAKVGPNGSLHYSWTSPSGKVIALMCQRQA